MYWPGRLRWLPKLHFVSWCVALVMCLVVALLSVSGVADDENLLLQPRPQTAIAKD